MGYAKDLDESELLDELNVRPSQMGSRARRSDVSCAVVRSQMTDVRAVVVPSRSLRFAPSGAHGGGGARRTGVAARGAVDQGHGAAGGAARGGGGGCSGEEGADDGGGGASGALPSQNSKL